jgi:hypothetical protein
MTDIEIDLFVQAFLDPPPCGFTEEERKQILNWLKSPLIPYLEISKNQNNSINFFQYNKD